MRCTDDTFICVSIKTIKTNNLLHSNVYIPTLGINVHPVKNTYTVLLCIQLDLVEN